jgi:hypothetical protein
VTVHESSGNVTITVHEVASRLLLLLLLLLLATASAQ